MTQMTKAEAQRLFLYVHGEIARRDTGSFVDWIDDRYNYYRGKKYYKHVLVWNWHNGQYNHERDRIRPLDDDWNNLAIENLQCVSKNLLRFLEEEEERSARIKEKARRTRERNKRSRSHV